MTTGIEIKPDVLRWAINASNKNVSDVRKKFKNIDASLSGATKFTMPQIDKLSKELSVPFGYLILNEPPEEDIELMKYRTINNIEHSKPSRYLIDTIKSMEKKQQFMRETLIDDGFSPLNFVGSVTSESPIIETASFIKKVLELPEDWNFRNKDTFKTLKNVISASGILVMQNGIVNNNTTRKLNLEEFRAFVLIDEYVPLIFLNATDSKKGMLFSLCHELVHIWLGRSELYNMTDYRNSEVDNEERYCNEVAAELLIPYKTLKYRLETNTEDLKTFIYQQASDYSISELVILIRLKNNRLIGHREFNRLYDYFNGKINESIKNKTKNVKANYFTVKKSRIDKRFLKTVDNKAVEGKILYSEAYDLVGASGDTYRKLIESMRDK
ncbi:ImmA/IrrE family metallo-endopeptidase [Macrococcus brunensis]|uniref:ImmA/IrrE family metallo-endopeptidase n=1 Tax=Macrococcus brunensis TaxID=198483 RepID=UPI001EEFDEE0|nr:ImmA/IrrE family metallo-endopeptidase [Macrococcus brunensis]ULG71490.1 ImmA/IrrE family metallo-endopeptidase [Macrococcus brunensis]